MNDAGMLVKDLITYAYNTAHISQRICSLIRLFFAHLQNRG